MNKWLFLSESLYNFGAGGITRVEAVPNYNHDGSQSEYKTVLYSNLTAVTKVRESVEFIKEKLDE